MSMSKKPNIIDACGQLLEMVGKDLKDHRKSLIDTYNNVVKGLLYDSAYTYMEKDGSNRPYRTYSTPDDKFPIEADGYSFNQIVAFTEDGIMSDANGGGASTVKITEMPVEDIILVINKLLDHRHELEKEKKEPKK
jgi:hypothetical protein